MVVTPCVGVWIEIMQSIRNASAHGTSLPAWECGLKSKQTLISNSL